MQTGLVIINRLTNVIIGILVLLLPLFFLPLTTDFYDYPKQGLLFLAVGILLILWTLKLIINQEVKFHKTPFDLPVLLIAVSYILSTIFISLNKTETLIVPGSTGTIIALTLLYFIITNNIIASSIPKLTGILIAGGGLLGLWSVVQFLGLAAGITRFSPMGGLLPLVIFLVVTLLLNIAQLVDYFKQRKTRQIVFHLFPLILITTGLGISLYQLVTGQRLVFLPYQAGWAIALETLKQSPFFGFGPLDFVSAFTRFKPLGLNAGDLWSIRFSVSSNWYFQLVSTVGLVGMAACALLVFRLAGKIKSSSLSTLPLIISAALIFLLLVFVPANFVTIFTLYILLAFIGINYSAESYSEKSKILPWMIFAPTLALVLVSFYFIGKDWQGEIYFKNSLDALMANKGTDVYNLQIKAISAAPYKTSYRLAYSQTNIILANAIVGNPPTGGLTDQDRQNVSMLIQQSIREAKAAVALSPLNAAVWENLAITYRSLINFAQGAEEWTVGAYQQAIALDPLNPNLRISLGGVYYSLANWEEAQRQFEITTQLKPNLANAHYNLSATLREQNKLEKAAAEMEAVVSLVPIGSQDAKKAQSELDALKKRMAETAKKESAKPGETLKTPAPAPQGLKPPLTLPTGAAPEISPFPTATP